MPEKATDSRISPFKSETSQNCFIPSTDQCVTEVRSRVNRTVVEPDIKVIHQERLDIAGNAEKRLRLGNIAITRPGDAFARHSVWGEAIGGKDIALGQHPIYASKNIIEISIGSQTYRIYAHVLDVSRKEQSHIYLLTQDQLPDFEN